MMTCAKRHFGLNNQFISCCFWWMKGCANSIISNNNGIDRINAETKCLFGFFLAQADVLAQLIAAGADVNLATKEVRHAEPALVQVGALGPCSRETSQAG